jgi:hypothetical protein
MLVGLHLKPDPVVANAEIAIASPRHCIGPNHLRVLRHDADIGLRIAAIAEAVQAKAVVETADQRNIRLQPDVGPMASPTAAAESTSATTSEASSTAATEAATSAATESNSTAATETAAATERCSAAAIATTPAKCHAAAAIASATPERSPATAGIATAEASGTKIAAATSGKAATGITAASAPDIHACTARIAAGHAAVLTPLPIRCPIAVKTLRRPLARSGAVGLSGAGIGGPISARGPCRGIAAI